MKKTIFLFISVFIGFCSDAQEFEGKIYYDSLKIMPPFKYYTVDGKAITQADLKKKSKRFLFT